MVRAGARGGVEIRCREAQEMKKPSQQNSQVGRRHIIRQKKKHLAMRRALSLWGGGLRRKGGKRFPDARCRPEASRADGGYCGPSPSVV
jgi:hypothetical protein